MSRAQAFRNDDVETLADHLIGGETKDGLRRRVPQPYDTLPIGEDDRIRCLLDDRQR
jgi:hypothetical protein